MAAAATTTGGELAENPPPTSDFPPPPKGEGVEEAGDDASTPADYMRDPHRLTAYLVPFPKPDLHKGLFHTSETKAIPERFLIYTPAPPPLSAPKEGEDESRVHKLQRKWQEEVREAKTSDAKVTSWKGVKGRATKGISKAMSYTTSSSLDFLNRVPGHTSADDDGQQHDPHVDDNHPEDSTTHKTVGLEEMVLVHPSTIPGTEEEIRQEFVNSMLRSKSKAQKDAIIATGLMPVSLAVDLLATVIWPFGGLAEIDGVWAYASMRGAKTARSVTKRLNSSSPSDTEHDEHKLKLTFTPSPRIEVLCRYLAGECHSRNSKYFKADGPMPTESEVLEAIGWSPSQHGGETRNWEDEQWEIAEVKDDLREVMRKGAREWEKWVKAFEKDPDKALKSNK